MTSQFQSIALAAFIAAPLSIEVSTAQAKQQCSAEMPSNPQGHWWSYRLIDGRKCWYEGKPGLSKSLLEWPSEVSAQTASAEEDASTAPEKPLNPLDSQAWAPNSAPTDPDTFEARWANIGARALPEEAASVTDAGPAMPEVDNRPPLTKADRLPLPYFDSTRAKMTRTLESGAAKNGLRAQHLNNALTECLKWGGVNLLCHGRARASYCDYPRSTAPSRWAK